MICAFGLEGLALVYISYPLRFAAIYSLFAGQILVFEIESWL